jgi:hypothetical protein
VGPQLRRQYRGCRRHRDCQQARANVPPSCLPKDQCSSLPAPPNPLQRIPRQTELGRARELIGGLTLAALGHHTTGSTCMMMMMMMIDGTTRSTSEPGPTLCLNCWMRTVEERVRKENVSELERDVLLAFEEQGSRHRLPLPAPPRPPAALLSHRTLGLINAEDPRPARRQKLHSVAIEALPATQLEIDKYHLRLPRICTRQLAGRRTPIVNRNFTTLLARGILMLRSITWWIGFRIWCEAPILRKARARGGSGSAGGGA